MNSEAERKQAFIAAGQSDYGTEPQWEVLKDQLTLRHSMANTGRGFAVTNSGGDRSEYASQTSIFMAWALTATQGDGTMAYEDLGQWKDWSAAAWTGWCAMVPGAECGNTLIHEIGHSQTMGHFTKGTAVEWGIADEYPQDGVNTRFHPWDYDTVSRRFRTWYNHLNQTAGKYDPMNSGEKANSETCFPQYTAYHAKKSQNWAKAQPVLLSTKTSGVPSDGAYLFNTASHQYNKIADSNVVNLVDKYSMPPVNVSVPVVTMIGILGQTDITCQTYPPLRSSSGNTFQFPDPLDLTLGGSVYSGASYFVEVTFQNGSTKRGLISVPKLSNSTDLRYFSFNVAVADQPIKVELYRYDTASYPNVTSTSSKTLLHTQTISLPADPLDGIAATVKVGRGWIGESGDVDLSSICVAAGDCKNNVTVLRWRGSGDAGSITYTSVVPSSNHGNSSTLTLQVTCLEDNSQHVIKVLATRFVNEISAPLLSVFPTVNAAADSNHGVKFWIPYELNTQLPFGTFKAFSTAVEATNADGSTFADLRLNFSLYLPQTTAVANLMTGYTGPTYNKLASSAYFLVTDASVGPTTSTWWGEDSSNLTVPLRSVSCNKEVTAIIRGRQQTNCGTGRWQMNAGRSANDCGHFLLLDLLPSSVNPWLVDQSLSGCKFETHPIKPIQINCHRWHDPNGGLLLGRMVLKMEAQL